MPSCSTAPDKFCFSKVNGISDEHRGQVIDGQIIMRVDIYYRFIGKVGTVDSNSLLTHSFPLYLPHLP